MPEPINIFTLLPDIAAIGRDTLQRYCSDWLQRPIAREYGIAQLNVRDDLIVELLIDQRFADANGSQAFVPIVELVQYIIDEHLPDAEKRRQLHDEFRKVRKEWEAEGRSFQATIGRVGVLHILCKNPQCAALLETPHKATEGVTINVSPTKLTCPKCHSTDMYDSRDFRLVFKD